MFCEVRDPNELWNKHWLSLSDDLETKTRRIAQDDRLKLLENELQSLAIIKLNQYL